MVSCLQLFMSGGSFPSSSSSVSVNRKSRGSTICSIFKGLPYPGSSKDPFLKKLSQAAVDSPELFHRGRVTMGAPPFLSLLQGPDDSYSPKISMASDGSPATMRRPRSSSPPPDLPSIMLDARIIYIAMPLVPVVSELIIAQLIYLQWDNPNEPIYIYINSTGTTRDDGEPVAMESEGFAIYDAMMMVKNELHTVCLGAAVGQACLILAAGTKGKRYITPHSTAVIQQPRIPPSGLQQTSDAIIRAKEIMLSRDLFVELMAKHTGNTVETITEKIKRPYFMDAVQARAFGVVDKIVWRGQEKMMKSVAPPEYWEDTSKSSIAHRFYSKT